ncbi:MAG: hypothetical protein AAB602_01720 [Patescibacteria group bacterium]
MEIFLITLGAILGIAGSIVGQFIDSRLRRKTRRNEYIAEREVDACVWIYPEFKKIMLHLDRKDPDFQNARKIVDDDNDRFWDNRLLLPPGVPEAWIYCRNAILDRNKEEATRQAQIAFPIICKEFGLKEFP